MSTLDMRDRISAAAEPRYLDSPATSTNSSDGVSLPGSESASKGAELSTQNEGRGLAFVDEAVDGRSVTKV